MAKITMCDFTPFRNMKPYSIHHLIQKLMFNISTKMTKWVDNRETVSYTHLTLPTKRIV